MNAVRSAQILTALLPLLALPTLVQADSRPDPKMDACIQAFVQSNLDKEQPVRVRKLASFGSPLDQYANSQTIQLSARLKDSGKHVASATCLVKGDKIVLNTISKPAPTSKVAQAETQSAPSAR